MINWSRSRSMSLSVYLVALLLNIGAHAATETVTIGLVGLFSEYTSNASAGAGDYVRRAMRMAIKEEEESLRLVGVKVVTSEVDYKQSEIEALAAAETITRKGVVAVLGYDFSSHALVAAPVHIREKIPFVTPTATADSLGVYPDYVFQVATRNRRQGQVIADLATNKLHAKRILSIAAADCAYCTDLEGAFKKFFGTISSNHVSNINVLSNDTQFPQVIDWLKTNGVPDAVFLPNYEFLTVRIIQALIEAGYTMPFLGGDGWTNFSERFFSTLRELKGFQGYALSHWNPANPNPLSVAFTKKYQTAYASVPNHAAAVSYDSSKVIIYAIKSLRKRGQTINGININAALKQIRHFKGVTGTLTFAPGTENSNVTVLSISPAGTKVLLDDRK